MKTEFAIWRSLVTFRFMHRPRQPAPSMISTTLVEAATSKRPRRLMSQKHNFAIWRSLVTFRLIDRPRKPAPSMISMSVNN